MAKVSATLNWQRALVILTGTVVIAAVIICLYWAQTVFIPVALAVFLAFLLAPLVTILQRRGLGRLPSVMLVALLTAAVLGGVVVLFASETTSLARDLPKYTMNLKERIRSLRELSEGSVMEGLAKMNKELFAEWASQPGVPQGGATGELGGPGGAAAEKQIGVIIQPGSSAWLSWLPGLLRPLVEALGGLALALVLAVFMLLKRENLRNRLIRLVGHGRMTMTTKALDDAGQRISRFLLMQLTINGCFGIVLSIGLLLLQVPHALLYGLLAAMLRYVPYLGSWITAALLMVLSLAVFPGWVQPLLVFVLIVVLELVTANVAEPRLFGHSMGVSEVALLVAAAFWAFLWGPVGLVLSSQLTVCLLVLGKYVPQLEFLYVLLGNEPSMDSDVTYYQRLLARDQDEATQLVLAQAKTSPPEEVYDKLLIPALYFVKQDRERDELTEADEEFILRATREIVEDLGEHQAAAAEASAQVREATEPPAPPKARILGCPGHDEADRLALEMLGQVLDPARWEIEILSLEMLSAETVTLAAEKDPAVVCIGALPPGGLAHTRYLCKRLRARLPHAKILVGRWGLKANVEQNQEQLREAGADQVETTLLETRDNLTAWLPVLAYEQTKTTANGAAGDGRMITVGH